ncbi:spermatogenesis-associated protein 48 [Archocentrus centrarchus]|uniref:spermatogenesis-associated protein 48 n=1 Tax=Archocentrus centrarchus TaxID=63155 RepID=UPI0011EA512C|nr:spermatogenesis-associated protein 48 [Archocentrus centrarchus]
MTAVLDPFKPFSSELHVIRRLNSSLHRDGGRDRVKTGHAGSLRPHPFAECATLAPLRDDVPLLDPCCGRLSAGAEVILGLKGRQKFIDFDHVTSALWVPPGFRERPQTAPNPSVVCVDLSEDKAWNSRRIPHATLRARLRGSSDPVKIQPHTLRTPSTVTISNNLPDAHPGNQGPGVETDISPAVRHFRYTSATHRSYEEVGWVTKIPRHLKAPETTLEKLADPVSESASLRRYNSRPQPWQSVGAEWSRRQLRLTNDAKKPISFCSTYPRSGQIPLYTGTIGSDNMDNIDNMDEDFHPLTLKRSIVPPYTPTARRTTIPGYTGKAAYADSAAASACSSGTFKELGTSVFGHKAPLSRTVTTVAPCSPFLRPVLPVSCTSAWQDFRQSR